MFDEFPVFFFVLILTTNKYKGRGRHTHTTVVVSYFEFHDFYSIVVSTKSVMIW